MFIVKIKGLNQKTYLPTKDNETLLNELSEPLLFGNNKSEWINYANQFVFIENMLYQGKEFVIDSKTNILILNSILNIINSVDVEIFINYFMNNTINTEALLCFCIENIEGVSLSLTDDLFSWIKYLDKFLIADKSQLSNLNEIKDKLNSKAIDISFIHAMNKKIIDGGK